MKYFHWSFWLAITLYSVNQIVEDQGVLIPFLYSYLDDFLCPFIVLGFTLAFQQQLTYRNPNYTFGIGHLVVFILVYSILFEGVFPKDDNRHFSDAWDILAYSIGGILFYLTGNKKAPSLVSLRWKIKETMKN